MIQVYEEEDADRRYPRKRFRVRCDDTTTDREVLSHPKIPKIYDPFTDSITSLRCAGKTVTLNPSDPTVWDVVCEYRAVDEEEPPCP